MQNVPFTHFPFTDTCTDALTHTIVAQGTLHQPIKFKLYISLLIHGYAHSNEFHCIPTHWPKTHPEYNTLVTTSTPHYIHAYKPLSKMLNFDSIIIIWGVTFIYTA